MVIRAGEKIFVHKPNATVKGFTLIELVTVMAIAAVAIGFFYTMFVTNWLAFGDNIARSNMWEDADEIVEFMSFSGREARQFDLSSGANTRSATVIGRTGKPVVVFVMSDAGELYTMSPSGQKSLLTSALDYANSSFDKKGKALLVNLALHENNLTLNAHIRTSSEIYPRN